MLMGNEKDIAIINKNNFQYEKDLHERKPNFRFPKNNEGKNKEPPPKDLIQEALKIVLDQQEELYCQRKQLYQEMKRLNEQLNSVLERLAKIDENMQKKHDSLQILTSNETTITQKEERANMIIMVHNNDL